jgi:hypothetical protein
LHAQLPNELSGVWIKDIEDATFSAKMLTLIAEISLNRQESNTTDILLLPALEIAGLYHCVLGSQQLDRILMLHFNALENVAKLAPKERRGITSLFMEKKIAIRMLSQSWI